ncbi:GONST1 [Scenedesmus sp. PABB004]|nr:GONST1 [Scenedesmus sp. PABB004]
MKKSTSGPDYGAAYQSSAGGFDVALDIERGPTPPGGRHAPGLHPTQHGVALGAAAAAAAAALQVHAHAGAGPGERSPLLGGGAGGSSAGGGGAGLLPRASARGAGGGGAGLLPRSEAARGSITASTAALASGALYSVSSAALTLLNKKVLVHYDFHALHALLAFHCALAVALVRGAGALGWAEVEPLSWELVRLWVPVNLIFVGMLATNFYALQLVGVGMVSVLKNLSNLFIIAGDWALFRRSYSWHVWVCLALMVASVFAGGATDLRFSWAGYGWQMVNNVFTAGYALYLSRVTERASVATHDHRPLNQMSMVYYNNLLSLPLIGLLVLMRAELSGFWGQPALYDRGFQALAVLGGALGFVISLSSIWFVSLTTATFYSLVGSFNKVLVAAVGIWWFGESTEPRNLGSIAAGLVAGSLLPFLLGHPGAARRLAQWGRGAYSFAEERAWATRAAAENSGHAIGVAVDAGAPLGVTNAAIAYSREQFALATFAPRWVLGGGGSRFGTFAGRRRAAR